MLPKEAIKEYRKLYEKRFNVILSDSEASIRANNLLKLYKAVLGSKSLIMGPMGNNTPTYEKD